MVGTTRVCQVGVSGTTAAGVHGSAILGATSPSPIDWIVARPAGGSVLTVIFDAALVALLLHPQSRAHQRLWYR